MTASGQYRFGPTPLQARELQTCTSDGPGASNTTKIPRKDPKEREERKKNEAREGKKREIMGPPPFGAPSVLHPSGPFWLHPSGPHFFQVWAPTLRGLHPSGHHSSGPPSADALAKSGSGIGLKRFGLNRSLPVQPPFRAHFPRFPIPTFVG